MITFEWNGLRLAGEESSGAPGKKTQYVYSEGPWDPLARVDSSAAGSEVYWYHTALNGLPERMTDAQGETVWQGTFSTWGETQREQSHAPLAVAQNLRFQGQYLDRETGLHYNLFRYYDPATGRYTQPDPIGLAGGLNTYAYVGDPLVWVDPLGWMGCRLQYMGRTPGKKSRTGKAVIERMRSEGRIRGAGEDMRFKSSTDGRWYNVQDADMAHLTDAVTYWNKRGGFYGAKTKEIRAWMRDPNNYELEYYGHNRSQGALLLERYKNPSEFIGAPEVSQYFNEVL